MRKRLFSAGQGAFLALLWAVGLLFFQYLGAVLAPLFTESWASLLKTGVVELLFLLGPLVLAGRKQGRPVLGPTVGSPRGRAGLIALGVGMALAAYPAMLWVQTQYLALMTRCGLTPTPSRLPEIHSWAELALALVSVGAAAAFAEEVCMRGTLQPALAGRLRPAGALWVTAAFFALLHTDYTALPYTLLLGALIGWLALRSRSLWPSLAFHLTNNALAVIASAAGGVAVETSLLAAARPVAALVTRLAAPLPALACGAVLAALALVYRRHTPGAAPVEREPAPRRWALPLAAAAGLLLAVILIGILGDMEGGALCVSMWSA